MLYILHLAAARGFGHRLAMPTKILIRTIALTFIAALIGSYIGAEITRWLLRPAHAHAQDWCETGAEEQASIHWPRSEPESQCTEWAYDPIEHHIQMRFTTCPGPVVRAPRNIWGSHCNGYENTWCWFEQNSGETPSGRIYRCVCGETGGVSCQWL